MLLDIDKITLEVVRGDTFQLTLPLNAGTREEFVPYRLNSCDFLYIGIMKPGQSFEHAEIRCALNFHSAQDAFGNPVFILQSHETAQLTPGKYYISIKYKHESTVQTLVDNKIFFVTGSNPCC